MDPRSPFSVAVPTNANPTEILAARFSAWRSILSGLLQYLNEVVSIQDEIVRQQLRLRNAANFGISSSDDNSGSGNGGNNSGGKQRHIVGSFHDNVPNSQFFVPVGNGSVQDLPKTLTDFHTASASLAQRASKELNTVVIPRLEDLRRELLVKIKEIKGLSSDFKNNVAKELAQTKIDMQQYLKSLEDAKFNPQTMHERQDPYLTKIILDKQIKRQIVEENYLQEAFLNLQSSGKELEKVVVGEIQNALTVFARLLGEQAQNVFDKLITNLDYGFLTKPPTFEWDQFIANDKNFIDENLPKRDYKSIVYEKDNDPFSFEVRSSFLERRSKFLKSYSKAYYVLTPTFLHEFKSADRKRDLIPVTSLRLDDIELEDHAKMDSKQYKFVLKKVGKLSSHKFFFRAESYEAMLSWYNDIKNLKSISNPSSRSAYAAKHRSAKDLSRVSSMTSRSQIRNSISHDSSTREVDTILTVPNNNLSLPTQTSSTLPPSMVNDAVYVKQVTLENASPAQAQRQAFAPNQQASQPPYPVQQPFFDQQYTNGSLNAHNSTEQVYSQKAPHVFVEPASPALRPEDSNGDTVDSYATEHRRSSQFEPETSGFSDEGKSAKKETHKDDLYEGAASTPQKF